MAVPPVRKRASSGQPAWLMTFADLMMLLLTFFILLLSFSEMNVEKYRAMVESMGQAFGNPVVVVDMAPVERVASGEATVLPELTPSSPAGLSATPELPTPPVLQPGVPMVEILPGLGNRPHLAPGPVVKPGIEQLAAELITQLEDEVASGRMAVNYDARRVVIRFSEAATFPSGAATVKPRIRPIIDEIVTVLAGCSGDIVVGGHTDDRPISSSRYRSNWDLSSARAVSVVHRLILDQRIDANRVTAAGHAETRPLVANDSEANRTLNRRVEISIYEPACDVPAAG